MATSTCTGLLILAALVNSGDASRLVGVAAGGGGGDGSSSSSTVRTVSVREGVGSLHVAAVQRTQSIARRVLRTEASRHLLAGAAAGVVSNTAVAPLDILRLNLMVSAQKTNVLNLAKRIYAQGGVLEFWRGNTADVLRTIPSSAVRFYSFAVYKARLPAALPAFGPAGPPLALTSLLAGGFAGMTAMALLFPLETVRTQMATSSAAGGQSLVGYTRGLLDSQGVAGLYRGLPASLVSVMPYFAVRFGVYDILKRWHQSLSEHDLGSQYSAVYGFAAGFSASALTFPMEVVRRRAMVGTVGTNPLAAIPAILRDEGVAGLYKGYGVNVVKVAPSSAITFCVYEAMRKALDQFAAGPAERAPAR